MLGINDAFVKPRRELSLKDGCACFNLFLELSARIERRESAFEQMFFIGTHGLPSH